MNSKKLVFLVDDKSSLTPSMRLHNFISKKNTIFLIVGLILLTGIIVALIWNIRSRGEASLAGLINYQAKLTDASNIPVADGDYNLRFRLCTDNASPCTAPIWAETSCFSPDSGTTCNGTGSDQRVAITNGFINVLLGQISSLLAVDFNQTLYLEVSVGGSGTTPSWETLTPTKKLSVVPSAFESMSLGGKTESEFATLSEEEIITSPWRFDISSSAPGISINQSGSGYGFFVNGSSLFGSLGSEKVTDGTFPSASNWTLGSGWSFDGTALEIDHSSGILSLEQDVSSIAGETYYITFEVRNRTAGTVTVAVGGVSSIAISTNGISQATLTATTTGNLTFTPTTDFDGSIDNVSVKKLNSTSNMYVMGNVGIGTTSPAGLLSVGSSSQFTVDSTGNMGITKVDPEIRLTDTGNSEYTRWVKSDTNNEFNIKNRISNPTSVDAYTKLLIYCNGTEGAQVFTDSSPSLHAITANGGVYTDTSTKKFGSASAKFDGAGDYLSTPNHADYDFGTGDWTIDFWMERNITQGSLPGLVSMSVGSASGTNMTMDATFHILVYSRASGAWTLLLSGSSVIPTDSTHIALVRNGNVLTLYVNGVADGTDDVTGYTFNSSGTGLVVGRVYTGTNNYYYTGNMDEVRVSKGIARWTTNFTPPTAEYGETETTEQNIISSTDSAVADERGINIFGNSEGKSIINGKTVGFQIGGVEKMQMDANGNIGIGTTSYPLKLDVAGSARFTGAATSILTGTIDPAASTTVAGVDTLFTTELVVGDRITVTGETRTVTAIASDVSLTVDAAFTDNANDTSPDKLAAIFVVRASDNSLKMLVNDIGDVYISSLSTAGFVKNDTSGKLSGGNILSAIDMDTVLPKRGTIWADQATVVTGNAVSSALIVAQFYNTVSFQGSPANLNAASSSFVSAAGTYIFTALINKTTNRGIVDFTIDGSSVSAGNDFYNATTQNNQLITWTVTLTAGYHTIQWTINGKNAASSSYFWGITNISFKQATD